MQQCLLNLFRLTPDTKQYLLNPTCSLTPVGEKSNLIIFHPFMTDLIHFGQIWSNLIKKQIANFTWKLDSIHISSKSYSFLNSCYDELLTAVASWLSVLISEATILSSFFASHYKHSSRTASSCRELWLLKSYLGNSTTSTTYYIFQLKMGKK